MATVFDLNARMISLMKSVRRLAAGMADIRQAPGEDQAPGEVVKCRLSYVSISSNSVCRRRLLPASARLIVCNGTLQARGSPRLDKHPECSPARSDRDSKWFCFPLASRKLARHVHEGSFPAVLELFRRGYSGMRSDPDKDL